MDERYEPRTDWRNIGLFWSWFDIGIRTPWGNVIAKRWRDRLFSERYGYTRTLKVLGLCITWVRLKRFKFYGFDPAKSAERPGNAGDLA